MDWDLVIGLETHVQLNTNSKIFSNAPTFFTDDPNVNASIIELALPGTLPVLNKEVVNKSLLLGLALKAKINRTNVFDRKNYFYPDLPKAYQISQLKFPIIENGKLEILIDDNLKTINITRAHIEEDAGKSLHDKIIGMTAIDLNRSGIPLLEVVSEPELFSAIEAVSYAKALHRLVVWLGICDGNMSKGTFRMDANVSIKPKGSKELGTRCEIKNLNSFKFLEQAINYEYKRQIQVVESGSLVVQQTRLFNVNLGETIAMRDKEDAHDYRYFPDPDLYPIKITDEMLQNAIKKMPELPNEMSRRFVNEYSLTQYNANLITSNLAQARYFEKLVKFNIDPKLATNWILGVLTQYLNKYNININNCPIKEDRLSQLLNKIMQGALTNQLAKQIFEIMWNNDSSVDEIIRKEKIDQVNDQRQIEDIIDKVIIENEKSVNEVLLGKEKALNSLIGQVMKLTKGKVNPIQVKQLFKDKIKKNHA